MTFYASDDKLATVGLAGKVDEINRTAVKVAREVASEGDALVAGNLSLTWAYHPEDPSSPDHVRELFDRQLRDQTDAGPPDFWIGETFSYLGEALLFVERAKATGLPVMVTMSFEQPVPRSYEGDTPAECARRLRDAGADIVGVNCLNGPEQQLPIALEMRSAVEGVVAAQPVAYRTSSEQPDFTSTPSFPYELDPLQLSRQEMATFARQAAGGWHRLHRLVLRQRPGARSSDGQGDREGPGGRTRMAEHRRPRDERVRVPRAHRDRGRPLPTSCRSLASRPSGPTRPRPRGVRRASVVSIPSSWAGTIVSNVADGVLTVTGTADADDVTVRCEGGDLTVNQTPARWRPDQVRRPAAHPRVRRRGVRSGEPRRRHQFGLRQPGGNVHLGAGGNDRLVGSEIGDDLLGGAGVDVISGESGPDHLVPGPGGGEVLGGKGRDTVSAEGDGDWQVNDARLRLVQAG